MNIEPDVRQQVMRRPEENQPYHLSRRLPSVGFMLFYSLVFFVCLFAFSSLRQQFSYHPRN